MVLFTRGAAHKNGDVEGAYKRKRTLSFSVLNLD